MSDDEDDPMVDESKIKPELQDVVLDVALDTESVDYDETERAFPSKVMDTIRLESTRAIINPDCYAVVTVRDDKLFLSPKKGEEEDENSKHLREHFSGLESEKAKQASSSLKGELNCNEEPWYHTQYFDVDSMTSKMERLKLATQVADDAESAMDLTNGGYIDFLVPKQDEVEGTWSPIVDTLTSVSCLRELPLPDQVKSVMLDVKVINAQQLSWMLKTDIERIVQCLPTCAVMVLGNWVLRSDLLYTSTHNGIPAQVMVRARDCILNHFHQGQTLQRNSLPSLHGLPQKEINEILSEVGVHSENTGWHFRLHPDVSFTARFPEIVEQQNLLWNARAKGIFINSHHTTTRRRRLRKRKALQLSRSKAALVRDRKNSVSSSDSDFKGASTFTTTRRRRLRKRKALQLSRSTAALVRGRLKNSFSS